MFRDRTNLFLAYRRTFPHHASSGPSSQSDRFNRLREEEEGLINLPDTTSFKDDPFNNESSVASLPKELLEVQKKSELMIIQIEEEINDLNKLYKKNLLPGFKDTSEDEHKINQISFKITRDFQVIYKQVSLLNDSRLSFEKQSQILMIDNLKKKLALKTQELSTQFRRLQNNYIRYLKEDEDELLPSPIASSSSPIGFNDEMESSNLESYSRKAIEESKQTQQQQLQQSNTISDEYIQQREKEIYQIAQSVVEISTIFKNLENIVIEQGTVLDRIDYNLNNSLVQFKKADKNLNKAETYQKATRKCKLVLLLVLLIILALMILLLKPSRTDHYYHDKPTENNPDNLNKGGDQPTDDAGTVNDAGTIADGLKSDGMADISPDGEIGELYPLRKKVASDGVTIGNGLL